MEMPDMSRTSIASLLLAGLVLASCANTIRGVGKDTRETGLAFQDGTTSVLKAGAKKN
jgi:predicted small secreted protein